MRSSSRIRAALMLSVLLALLVAPLHAFAQAGEPSAADRTRARRLFEEATELEAKHEWSLAAAKLEEALGIVETPGLRYHLAYCQEGQGLMVEALANYERAQQMIAAGSKAPDVAELLAPKRDALLARIPKLRVRARAPAVLERVAVDGAVFTAGQASEPIHANPGRRKVTAWAQGQQRPIEREVVLSEGRVNTEEFAWPDPAAGAASATPGTSRALPAHSDRVETAEPPPSGGLGARTVVLIAEASLTAAALGVGIGFLVSSREASKDADGFRAVLENDACDSPSPADARRCAALQDAIDREQLHEGIAIGGFIAAGAGAVATVATFLLWSPPPSGAAALAVGVTPMAQGGALELRGRF